MNKAQQVILQQDLDTARQKLATCASIQDKINQFYYIHPGMTAREAAERGFRMSESERIELYDLERQLEFATKDLFMTMQASKVLDRLSIT